MARTKRGRTKRLILDIGANTIRVCELAGTKTGYQLTKYAQREVLDDPALDDEEKQRLRVEALREMLAETKIRSKKTVFGVPGRSVFSRTRALPPVPEHKVTQIVRYEIQQQIPFSLDQIALDYQVLERTEAGGYEVMMAAIKVDVVEKELEILRHVKRSAFVVDVCPIAAYNWLKRTGALGNQGDCVALIDMGAATTDIVIERDNQFRFTRPLNMGGNDVTRAISKEFNQDFPTAEKLKRERGFAPTGDAQRDGKGGEVIGRVLSRLVSEINRSFAYFRSQPGGGPVQRVVLTGGAAMLRNMAPYLQRELGVEVRLAQPLGGIEIGEEAESIKACAQQAPVVLGLALRCCEPVAIEVNLVPPRVIEAARRREQLVYWALIQVTVILIFASVIPVGAAENKVVKERVEILKGYIEKYDPEVLVNPEAPSRFAADLRYEKGKVERRQRQVEVLDNAKKGRRFWLGGLEVINNARPPGGGVWFSSLETSEVKPGNQKQDVSSSGFCGIDPLYAGGASAGTYPLLDKSAQSVAPPDPNGFRIFGYAEDTEALKEFIQALRDSGRFGEEGNGVFFDQATVEMVPISQMDNARVSGHSASSSPGGMNPNAMGGMQPGMNRPMPAQPPAGGGGGGGGETVLTFRVDLLLGGIRN